jgi:hypothetical protein
MGNDGLLAALRGDVDRRRGLVVGRLGFGLGLRWARLARGFGWAGLLGWSGCPLNLFLGTLYIYISNLLERKID